MHYMIEPGPRDSAELAPRCRRRQLRAFGELAARLADVTLALRRSQGTEEFAGRLHGIRMLLVCDAFAATLSVLQQKALELAEGDWVRLLTAAGGWHSLQRHQPWTNCRRLLELLESALLVCLPPPRVTAVPAELIRPKLLHLAADASFF